MPSNKEVSEVSKGTVYSERYNEMRRYRDYELTASTWYSVILLGILGFLISAKFGDNLASALFKFSPEDRILIQIFTAVAVTLIGACSLFSVRYVASRYDELREHVTRELEPPKWMFTPREFPIQPRHAIYAVQLLMVGASNAVLFTPPVYAGAVAFLISVTMLPVIVFCCFLKKRDSVTHP
jgi:hypothetical protein